MMTLFFFINMPNREYSQRCSAQQHAAYYAHRLYRWKFFGQIRAFKAIIVSFSKLKGDILKCLSIALAYFFSEDVKYNVL